ncbi:MAG: hypothetical protein EHM21_08095 [Chloroflexi bacterium]|nr:MAG: hypothetical protein EHM21_08095 [Chloroflexota bacterium]
MRQRFGPYDLPLALFLISAVTGILPAYDRSLSMTALVALLGGGLLYTAISRLASTRARWDAAALGLAAVTVLVSGYYVTQLGHMGFEEKIAPLARAAAGIARFTPDLAYWKPLGNTIGTFLEGGLFLLVGLALVTHRPVPRALLLAGLGFTILALLFSASRGAWLAVLAAGLLWAALYLKPARWLIIAAAVGLAMLALYALVRGDIRVLGDIPGVGAVLGPLFVRPDRLEVYYNSLALIRDVPFTGIGLGGQFAMAYSRYELLLHVPFLYYAHNLFLEIWLEQGLLGIFAWVWLVTTVFTTAWGWRGTDRSDTRIRFESTWIGLTAVLIHALSDARQAQALLSWLPFFTLLGLNAALVLHGQVQTQPHNRWVRYLPAGAGAACLLLGLVSAWPLPASIHANQAALIQQRADLASQVDQREGDALLDQSAGLFKEALNTDPDNRTANQRLGLIALSRQEFDPAVQFLSAAHTKDPRHPGTRRALGLAYAFTGRLAEALPLLRDQLNIVDELNYWGWYYSTHDQPLAGLNAMRMSLLLQPNQPDIQQYVDQSR